MMFGGTEYLVTLALVALDSLDTVHILEYHQSSPCRGQILSIAGRQTPASKSTHYHYITDLVVSKSLLSY